MKNKNLYILSRIKKNKMIKKFSVYVNENIDWNWFQEEIEDDNFKIGNMIILKSKIYEKTRGYSVDRNQKYNYDMVEVRSNNEYFIEPQEIIAIEHRSSDGKKIAKLRGKWPWFLLEYWKKKI